MKIKVKSWLLCTCVAVLCSTSSVRSLLTTKAIPTKSDIPCSSEVMNPTPDQDDRKLVSEATPVSDDNQMTDPTKGSDMNKVDIKGTDQYGKMDLIVNDIKQVDSSPDLLGSRIPSERFAGPHSAIFPFW